MTANKAPEKIYLTSDEKNSYVFTQKRSDGKGIEYTRTDSFIKKAEDYLNSKLYDWVSITNPDQRSYANVIPKKDFIEDFKNYMK